APHRLVLPFSQDPDVPGPPCRSLRKPLPLSNLGRIKSSFLGNLGHGDPSKILPRLPRLDLDEACTCSEWGDPRTRADRRGPRTSSGTLTAFPAPGTLTLMDPVTEPRCLWFLRPD